MKILFVTSCASLNAGGLFTSVRKLAINLKKQNANIEVFAIADERGQNDMPQWLPVEPTLFKHDIWLGGYRFSKEMYFEILKSQADIVHVHGIRTWPSTAARVACSRSSTPLVISPRGQLDPWVMHQNRVIKIIMHSLFENRNLKGANEIHVTCEMEKKHVSSLNLNDRMFVVPNGVELGTTDKMRLPQEASNKLLPLKDRRMLLFLSNIHPKKGLDMLCAAWADLAKHFLDWILVIAGSGDSNYVQEVKANFETNLPKHSFLFMGDVRGDLKQYLYENCDVFVLPTYNESFGNVVAEAMAAKKPVITTKGAPWKCLSDINAGWWVNPQVDSIREAIESALTVSDGERSRMGERGKDYVLANFLWPQVASEMLANYERIVKNHSAKKGFYR